MVNVVITSIVIVKTTSMANGFMTGRSTVVISNFLAILIISEVTTVINSMDTIILNRVVGDMSSVKHFG